jgi:hypothetical protein
VNEGGFGIHSSTLTSPLNLRAHFAALAQRERPWNRRSRPRSGVIAEL